MKNLFIIMLFALCYTSVFAIEPINTEDHIKNIEIEYLKKFDKLLDKTDLKYNKLRNFLRFQKENKVNKKMITESFNKLNLYLKEHSKTKFLYIQKQKKLEYINKNGNLNGFLTSEKIKKIKENINLLEKEKEELSSNISELSKSLRIGNKDYVKLVLKSDNINDERLRYRNKLIMVNNTESKIYCKKFNSILTKLNILSPTLETPKENIEKVRILTKELISLNKKILSYKFIPDEKYNKLKEKNDELLKQSVEIQKKIKTSSFGSEIMKKSHKYVKKSRDIELKIAQLKSQIDISSPSHKHTANCKH